MVGVQTENIDPDELDNFDQHITDGDDVGAYDYASIMHYSRKAFSKNGEDTIVPLGGQSIGQRDGLSAGDVAAIRSIYPDLERPLLFRIGGGADPATLVARAVLDVPDVLGRTGHAATALAVHPTLNQRVLLGGARHAFMSADGTRQITNTRGNDDAALLAADVAAGAGGQLHVGGTPMSLGAGVYPFVHHIVFSNSGNRLWVASDGGIYRSQPASQRFGFAALAGGVRAHEANAIAQHPRCEGGIVASLQGHGIAERQSGAAWRCVGSGEGGGAAFDPTQPQRYVHQVERGRWRSSDDVLALSLPRGEDDAARCARYSTPALVTHERPDALQHAALVLHGRQRGFDQLTRGSDASKSSRHDSAKSGQFAQFLCRHPSSGGFLRALKLHASESDDSIASPTLRKPSVLIPKAWTLMPRTEIDRMMRAARSLPCRRQIDPTPTTGAARRSTPAASAARARPRRARTSTRWSSKKSNV